jgi:hypothetical protein
LNWSTFLATLAGGGFAIAGAIVGQVMTKRREFHLDEKRATRAAAAEVENRRREVIMSAAEYAQSLDARLKATEDEITHHAAPGPDVIHRDLLTARIRTLGVPLVQSAWMVLRVAEDWYEGARAMGDDYDVVRPFDKPFIYHGQFYMIGSHAAVEAVMFAATATLDEASDDRDRFAAASIALSLAVGEAFEKVQNADPKQHRKVCRT